MFPLQTSTTVRVHIIDENDNAPAFAAKEYVTILTEGPDTLGATIATVTASDPDEGLNGTLRYAITFGNVAQTFSISPTTVGKNRRFLRTLCFACKSMWNVELRVCVYAHRAGSRW